MIYPSIYDLSAYKLSKRKISGKLIFKYMFDRHLRMMRDEAIQTSSTGPVIWSVEQELWH